MKIRLVITAMLALATSVSAQEPASISKEKMKLFSSWIGRWQGEGVVRTGTGESKKSQVVRKWSSTEQMPAFITLLPD